MKFVVLTCVWKRLELTRIVLQAYQRLREKLAPEIELCLLAVGSEGDRSRTLAQSCGFDYVESVNQPVSRKWNRGARAARAYDPDAIIIVGSDDVISRDLVRWHALQLGRGHHFLGLLDLYFFELASLKLGYWAGNRPSAEDNRVGEPIGCGRCFSRPLLERTDWNLWPLEFERNSKLDSLTFRFLRAHGFDHEAWRMKEVGAHAVDIKTDTNINPFDAIEYEQLIQGSDSLDVLRPLLGEEGMSDLLDLHASGAAR